MNIKQQKRRIKERNQLKPIRFNMPKGLTREQFEAPFDGHPGKGVLLRLYEYSGITPLNNKQLGVSIYQEIRVVKNIMEHYIMKSILKDDITKYLYRNDTRVKWMLNEKYRKKSFDELLKVFLDSHYQKDEFGRTCLEIALEESLEEIVPGKCEFTGSRIPKNRIKLPFGCRQKHRYPDYTFEEEKIMFEAYGNWCHGVGFTKTPKHLHELYNVEDLLQIGYKCLVIWEHIIKNKKLLDERLNKFFSMMKEISIETEIGKQEYLRIYKKHFLLRDNEDENIDVLLENGYFDSE